MRHHLLKTILSLLHAVLLCSSVALAQSRTPPPTASSDEPTAKLEARKAESDAFSRLTRISDLDQRIEALEKWMAEHPTHDLNSSAKWEIFRAVVKKYPHQKARLLALADEYIRLHAGGTITVASRHNQLASELLEAGLYLDEAEQFIRQALAFYQRDKYMKETKEDYKQRGRTPPAEEVLAERYTTTRARYLTTLGRIELKKGDLAEAEKTLKEAHVSGPATPALNMALAEIAEKKGDDAAAFEYLLSAVFMPGAPKQLPDRVTALYRRLHSGPLDGLEAMLDKKYHEAFPFKVEPYKGAASRGARVVLAELFTGTGCGPCVGADLAFDGVLERYQRQDVAVLVYHQHIPLPDPMANPTTGARASFYGVRSTPSYAFDGDLGIGGGSREGAKKRYDEFTAKIDKGLETPAEAMVKLSAWLDGSVVKVKATVDQIKAPSNDLKLHIALAENLLKYVGENGVRFHPMVVWSMAGADAGGLAIDPFKATSIEYTFDVAKIAAELKTYLDEFEAKPPERFASREVKFRQKLHAIDLNNLSVVAFVQGQKSKRVLQAAYVKLEPEATAANPD